MSDTRQFFDQLSHDYDAVIARWVPRYAEMFWAMLYYLPQDFTPHHILELGCGTGNLTRVLRDRWPEATITVVDFSGEMLAQTQAKVGANQLNLVESAFEALQFPASQFDLVISSLALHHVADVDKPALLDAIGRWLVPNGFFVLGDQVRSSTPRLYDADVAYYEHFAQQQGASAQDVVDSRAHRDNMDHYVTLADLTRWMTDAGLQHIEVLWRYCFWAVMQGQK